MQIIPYNIETLFLLFMIYSICGWIVESILKTIQLKKFVNRGFLIGPYCPIYGYGALIMTCLLERFSDNIFLLFSMSMLICSILEYLTSFIMEKLFRARWWDYSHKKFNINGRICLLNAIFFGIGGIIVINLLNPLILDLINSRSSHIIDTTAILLFAIFLVDNVLSIVVISNISHETRIELKDSTIEISEKVKDKTKELQQGVLNETGAIVSLVTNAIVDFRKEVTKKIRTSISKRSYIYRRIIDAYPNFEIRLPRPRKIKREIIRILQERKILRK